MLKQDIERIEKTLGYFIKNKELLIRAFTHSSYANEHNNEESYERLEFLGDATLNYLIGLYLYDTFPSFTEGKLTKMRAGTVDKETVAKVVDELGLLSYLRIGKGSEGLITGQSVKVKCDLFEAILGAIVIDNNEDLSIAKKLVEKFLHNKISLNNTDYKSKVLEHCARNAQKASFVLLKEGTIGPDRFEIALLIDNQEVSRGLGENKKSAERRAAELYFKTL